jgi:hypothetical protein
MDDASDSPQDVLCDGDETSDENVCRERLCQRLPGAHPLSVWREETAGNESGLILSAIDDFANLAAFRD